jgi:hypothetical protein
MLNNKDRWLFAEMVSQDYFGNGATPISLRESPRRVLLFRRLKGMSIQLERLADLSQGIIVYKTKADREKGYIAQKKAGPAWQPSCGGSDLERYAIVPDGTYVKYGEWLWCPRDPKYFTSEKLLFQRIRNPSLSRKLLFAYDDGELYNRHTLSNLILRDATEVSIFYLLALLNSHLLNEFYRTKFSDVEIRLSNVRQLPIRRIEFTTPADERERLAAAGIAEATEWIEAAEGRSVESASFSAFSDSSLGRWLDARLTAEPKPGGETAGPQSDVVHDLLAHLAERMIEMHEQKQERVEAFWLDLEGVTDPDTFEDLREHGKWGRSLWRASEDCRPFVGEESRSTRHLDESLGWNEDCFKVFVKALAGRVSNLSDVVGVYRRHHPPYRQLVQRIEATDRLIDQIVYRLYGLSDEEIAVVEGSEQ